MMNKNNSRNVCLKILSGVLSGKKTPDGAGIYFKEAAFAASQNPLITFSGHTFLIFLVLILNSCLGITTDINMRKDGSGRIAMEYRISRMADTVGRLDGNEGQPIIPIGRNDWERTIARIPDIKLVSFSSKEKGQDTVVKATLEFNKIEALMKFLDPSGKYASISRENGVNKLHIILHNVASSQLNPDLLELMKQVSNGYSFKINVNAAKSSVISFTDGAGKEITPPQKAQVVSSGKKASLSIETAEILSSKDGLGVIIRWE